MSTKTRRSQKENAVPGSSRTTTVISHGQPLSNNPAASDSEPMDAMMKKLSADLQKERKENQALTKRLNLLKTKSTNYDGDEEIAQLRECLEREREDRLMLQQRLDDLEASDSTPGSRSDKPPRLIHRPKGTAGRHWSIQQEMGLGGTAKGDATYKAIQRSLRDLTLNARINWESAWIDIPASEKSKLFKVARERHPVLKQYVNDWATEALVKQYMKNKRKNHYANNWLEVPQKYAHLKENARKRNPDASRIKRVKVAAAAKKKGKRTTAAHRKPGSRSASPSDADSDSGPRKKRRRLHSPDGSTSSRESLSESLQDRESHEE